MRNSLDEALAAVFGGAASPPPDGETPPPPSGGEVPEEVAALLDAAAGSLAEAEVALRNGDLAAYQASVDEARDFIARAVALSTTPTP